MSSPIRILYVDGSRGSEAGAELEEVGNGLDVTTATGMADGLTLLREQPIDGVVASDRLSDGDAFEFLEAVRKEFPALPFVLLVDGDEAVASDAIAAGATDVRHTDLPNGTELLAHQLRRLAGENQRVRQQTAPSTETLLEQFWDGFITLDEDWRFTHVNESAAQLFGTPAEDLLGECIWELFSEATDTPFYEAYHETVSEGDPRTIVEYYEPWDRWFRTYLSPHDGGLSVIFRDITTRKEREQERERQLDAIESAQEGISILDEHGRFVYVNEAYAKLYGYSAEEMVGEHWALIYRDEDVAEIREEILSTVEAEGYWRGETTGLRADGSTFVEDHTLATTADGGLVCTVNDITDRKQRKRRFEAIFNNTYTFVGLLEPDGTVLEANETALSFGGLDREEVVGKPLWETAWVEPFEPSREAVREGVEHASSRALYRDEIRVQGSDREAIIDFSIRPVTDDSGTVELLVPEGREITERKQQEDRIAGLNELLTEFIDADDESEICERTVAAARATLTLPVALIARLDDEQGSFRVVAGTPDARDTLDTERILDVEGPAWQAYTADEQLVLDVDEGSPFCTDAPEREGLVVHPLGEYGVFLAGVEPSGRTDGTADTAMAFVETVGESLRTVLTRVEREHALRERERRLEERTEQLRQINRLNGIIRSIDRELVDATDRAEIEQRICSELVSSGPYRFGWVGTYDAREERVAVQADAGDGRGYLDDITPIIEREESGQEPALEAIRTEEPQVVDSIRTDPPYEPWREAALKRGFRSAVALPIVYRERLYGVLALYTDEHELVDEQEQEVLTELAVNMAHAINAVEVRRALVSDMLVELELQVETSEIQLLDTLGEDAKYTLTLETMAPAEDGTYRVVVTSKGVAPERLETALQRASSVRECELLTDRSGRDGSGPEELSSGPPGSDQSGPGGPDAGRLKCLLGEESFISWLFDHAAVPRSIQVTGRRGRISVHLPPEENVREFVELFQSRYDGTELLARRNLERGRASRQALRGELEAQFTARQQEVLRFAYESGYFESPRERTASELADTLDISQPTFTNHLRASQRKLLDQLYENDPQAR